MMFGSYMDESFDRQPTGVFAVGGILGRGIPLFELERRWEKLLRQPGIDIKYFKASDCQSGTGEFAKFVIDPKHITAVERAKLDSISHDFLRLIAHPVLFDPRPFLCVQGTGVVQGDFYDIIKDPKARAVLGDSPYWLAYHLAMIQCAWAMKELGDGQPGNYVSFDCDQDQEHSSGAEKAYKDLKATNPDASEYMGSFSSRDEKECFALQAADAAIFEVRRALNLALKLWPGALRDQFNLLADDRLVFLVTHTNREQLEWIVANHKPGDPYKLDELMNLQLGDNIDKLRP
jgi:hypothetical protein